MPKYEYNCTHGHVVEIEQSIHACALAVCPKCGQQTYRVIQPVTVLFQGGGWTPKFG
jgi:putative FmdB family regulatory protein